MRPAPPARLSSRSRVVPWVFILLPLSVAPSASWGQASEPITFSVIGDAPYPDSEIAEFQQHMLDHNVFSPSDFLVHVGDIKAGSDECREQRYQVVADSLRLLAVPAFILPGDNEWVDCSNPDQAWAWWEEHLLGIEADFCGTPAVDAQTARPENFAFVEKDVLFIGLNLATTGQSALVQDDADWVDEQFAAKGAQARAAVIFAHREAAGSLLDAVSANAALFGQPVLYVHGNGHSYEEEPGAFGQPNVLRIQVPRGTASNPPIHFSVDENGDFALESDPWPPGTAPFNRAPCVDAGPDLVIALGEVAALDGRVVDDGDGGELSVAWSELSGPGAVAFSNPTSETTTASFSEAGVYVLALAADDGSLVSSDSLQVAVTGAPTLSVDDLFVTEGGSAVFTVTLEGADGSSVTVDYATADGSARAGSDYAATSGSLSFSGSVTQRQVSVAVQQDSLPEAAETFFLDLSNAAGALIGKARGAAVILDDDGTGTQFTLTVSASAGGSVTLSPPGGTYAAGTVVTLTAVPAAGFSFTGWGGALSGTANPATLVVDANKSVTASFTQIPQFTLTVSPSTGGSVTLSPPGGTYPAGTVVTLTAVPAAGFSFTGWSGALSGTANPATLVVDGNKTVTAAFVASQPGEGVVFREVESGGSTSSTVVATAAPLTGVAGNLYVAAIASKSWRRVSSVSGLGLAWTPVRDQCAGRSQTGVEVWTAQGQPSGDGVVTATLASAPSNAVIAVARYSGARAAGPVGNVVSANSVGVSGGCAGGVDSAAYAFGLTTTAPGSLVFVAAAMRTKDHIPGSGYTERLEVFQGSGGSDMAGTSAADRVVAAPGVVSVDGSFSGTVDWAVVAVEIRPDAAPAASFEVRIDPAPTGGSVTLSPPGGTYAAGTVVTLTAVPAAGYSFTGWGGALSGTANPATLVVDANKSVTASFSGIFTLTVSTQGKGSVTLDPPGAPVPGTTGSFSYSPGTVVTLTAVPGAGFAFSDWTGDLSGTANPETLSMDGNRSVRARFRRSR